VEVFSVREILEIGKKGNYDSFLMADKSFFKSMIRE
jgi:hypothetical protein